MRFSGLILLAAALAGAFLLGVRGGDPTGKPPAKPRSHPVAAVLQAVAEEAPAPLRARAPEEPAPPPPPDVRARLLKFEGEDIGGLEEELEARLSEDPACAEALFSVFKGETDPVKLSFLQNVIASNPLLRNSAEWQDRFVKVAEADPLLGRRAAALLFVQQAETIRPVRDRLFALAETPGEVRDLALVALKGLPGRRLPDARLLELAGRLAEGERDPLLRGLALRIEGNPQRAARFLADPDRTVRMQAALVAEARPALEAALKAEEDPEARELLERRLADLSQAPRSE